MDKLRTVLFLFFLSREKDFCVRVVVSSVRSGEKGWGSVGGKKNVRSHASIHQSGFRNVGIEMRCCEIVYFCSQATVYQTYSKRTHSPNEAD